MLRKDTIIKVFNAKPWRIFLVLFTPSFIGAFTSGAVDTIFYILSAMLIYSWMLILGTGLTPTNERRSTKYVLFIVAIGLMISATIAAKITVAIGYFARLDSYAGVIIVVGVITFILLAIICGYVARKLLIAEKGNDVGVGNYIGEAFLIFFWPVGIWVIQPRLNNIAGAL